MKSLLIPFAVLVLACAVCSAIEIQRDIAYLGEDREEKLDVYLPDTEPIHSPLPAVILIHGGGWGGGDKASKRMQSMAEFLADEGYAVFSINYLLNIGERDPETRKYHLEKLAWPQNFLDCKSALRYVRAHAGHYGIDPERIGLIGTSAGGHLAMLVGGTANDPNMNAEGLYRDESNEVACIVNMYGPFDTEGKAPSPLMGSTPEVKRALGKASSPKTYMDEDFPPILILHGSADATVSVDSSRELARYLTTLGCTYEYIEIEDAPHSFNFQPEQMDLRPAVIEFLNANL